MQATERVRRMACLSGVGPCGDDWLRRPPCVMPWWHCHSEMAAHAYLQCNQRW